MAVVSVRRVENYDPELLYQAVSAHFEALEIEKEILPGMRVLLKPNLLAARDPSTACTTHPQVLRAVARWLRAHGVEQITLADSPGGVYTPQNLKRVYSACGLLALEDVLTLNYDTSSGMKGGFSIITPVLQADYIINCPKLKTHGLATMTAGVKNLFGCIPGLKKPEMHCVKSTIDAFSRTLVELCDVVKPQLTLLDAVDCMEGNGPGGGTVRHMGYTLCSRSPYDLDWQGARLMGIQPAMAPVIRTARAMGRGEEDIPLVGDELVPAAPPFRLPDAVLGHDRPLSFMQMFRRLCGRPQTYPVILKERCVGCGRCAESCPRHLIHIQDGKAVMQRRGCIACYCCQEMCPAHAIEARKK